MSVSIVNGYVCFNCTDAAKAAKGIDPANPTNDPAENKSAVQKRSDVNAVVKAEQAKTANRGTKADQSGTVSGGLPQAQSPALLSAGLGTLLDVTA